MKVECTCVTCGAKFQRYDSWVKQGGGRFCSQSCHYASRVRAPLEDRFWSKVKKGAGCWLWQGRTSQFGHGILDITAGKGVRAHRYSWELVNGPIPEGLVVCHLCDVPACVRPDHLTLGTRAYNSNDMWTKGRGRPGVARGERQGSAKMTEAKVRAIRARYARGDVTHAELAAKHSVTPAAISHIVNRRNWRHVE